MPAITSFSDCIVLSIGIEKIDPSFNMTHYFISIIDIINQIAVSLMCGPYLLRGAITKGPFYHNEGVVFGKALIDAHKLESEDAKYPRIIVAHDLAEEYNQKKSESQNYLTKDQDPYYYVDYLKIQKQNCEVYKQTAADTISGLKSQIVSNIKKESINLINEDLRALEKWIYFKTLVDKT